LYGTTVWEHGRHFSEDKHRFSRHTHSIQSGALTTLLLAFKCLLTPPKVALTSITQTFCGTQLAERGRSTQANIMFGFGLSSFHDMDIGEGSDSGPAPHTGTTTPKPVAGTLNLNM